MKKSTALSCVLMAAATSCLVCAAGFGVLSNTAIVSAPFITFTNGFFMGHDPNGVQGPVLIIGLSTNDWDIAFNHDGTREISMANGVVNAGDEGLYVIGSGGDGYSCELFENGTAQFAHTKTIINENGDIEFLQSSSGPILHDTENTNRYRLKVSNGFLQLEGPL